MGLKFPLLVNTAVKGAAREKEQLVLGKMLLVGISMLSLRDEALFYQNVQVKNCTRFVQCWVFEMERGRRLVRH